MKKIYLTIIALIATLAISAQVEEFQMEYVDLGLPSGTLWATCNVGAKSPEQIGTFYAWGEIEPKDDYELGNYKWMAKAPASEFQYEKYTYADGQTSASWYNGNSFIGDGKTELEIEDDAATANWSDKWCMPTSQQFDELVNPENTEFEWTFVNGVIGIKFTSKRNGNTIFFPAAGYRHYRALDDVGSEGLYWARDIYRYTPYTAMQMDFVKGSNTHHPYSFARDRYNGQSVRPVLVQRRY